MSIMFLLSALIASSQELQIPWSPEYKLCWEDFQGPTIDSIGSAALTVADIDVRYRYVGDSFSVQVYNNFQKRESFVDKRKLNLSEDNLADLLDHEQIHFDIVEVYARLMRKQLQEIIESDSLDNEQLVNRTIDQTSSLLRSAHDEYDRNTGHGIYRLRQSKWRSKVDSMLTELDDYHSPNVKMRDNDY